MISLDFAVFLSEEDYKKEITKTQQENKQDGASKSKDNKLASYFIGGVFGFLFPGISIAAGVGLIAAELITKHKKKNSNDFACDAKIYSIKEIPPSFVFVNNQIPELRTVYVSCNYKPYYYYPLSEFNEYLVKIKEDAIREMMRGLGAKNLSWEKRIVKDNTIGGKLSINKIKASLKTIRKRDSDQRFSRSYDKPSEIKKSSNPFIVENEHWSEYQDSRFEEAKLTNSQDHWIDEDEFYIDADFAAKFKKLDFSIGGDYKTHLRKEYHIIVDYWDV